MLLEPVGAGPDPGIVEARRIKADSVRAAKEDKLPACGIICQAGIHTRRRRIGRMLLSPIAAIPGPGVAEDRSPPGVIVPTTTEKHYLPGSRIIGDGRVRARDRVMSRVQLSPGRAIPGPGIDQQRTSGVILSAEEQERIRHIVINQWHVHATGWRNGWHWSGCMGSGKLRRHGGMSGRAGRLMQGMYRPGGAANQHNRHQHSSQQREDPPWPTN